MERTRDGYHTGDMKTLVRNSSAHSKYARSARVSTNTSTLGPQSLRGLCKSGRVLGFFPSERAFAAFARLATKVAVRRGWRIDWLEQIQMFDDASGSQIKEALNQL